MIEDYVSYIERYNGTDPLNPYLFHLLPDYMALYQYQELADALNRWYELHDFKKRVDTDLLRHEWYPSTESMRDIQPEYYMELVRKGAYDDRFLAYTPEEEEHAPLLPIDDFPSVLGEMVKDTAKAKNVPVDFCAAAALGALSMIASQKFWVQGREQGDWMEPLSLFILCVAPPGSGKSQALAPMIKPLVTQIANFNEAHKLDIQSRSNRLKRAKSQLRKLQDGKGTDDENKVIEDMRRLQEEINGLENGLKSRRWLLDNATPEAITENMSLNDGKSGIFTAEMGVFQNIAGLYNGGTPVVSQLNQAYSGESITVNRKGTEPIYIKNPVLTITAFVQSRLLSDVVKNRTFMDSGFLARFCIVQPDELDDVDYNAPSARQGVICSYARIFEQVDNAKGGEIKLSSDAYKRFIEYRKQIDELKRCMSYSDFAVEWLSKSAGLLLRIAGLLHISLYPTAPTAYEIKPDTLGAAYSIMMYVMNHTFTAVQCQPESRKKKIERLILRNEQLTKNEYFTLREMQQYLKMQKSTANECIQSLIEDGFLRKEIGTRKSIRLFINPVAQL